MFKRLRDFLGMKKKEVIVNSREMEGEAKELTSLDLSMDMLEINRATLGRPLVNQLFIQNVLGYGMLVCKIAFGEVIRCDRKNFLVMYGALSNFGELGEFLFKNRKENYDYLLDGETFRFLKKEYIRILAKAIYTTKLQKNDVNDWVMAEKIAGRVLQRYLEGVNKIW